jgi:ribosomal protein S1
MGGRDNHMDALQAMIGMQAGGLIRGEVRQVSEDGVVVRFGQSDEVTCDLLESQPGSGNWLGPGDRVVVWREAEERDRRPIVLGRIALARSHQVGGRAPDELTIEASKNLTLRCGSGSITLRADGKILIKGKDLVSHAQRLNRIKGGAVQIN